MNDIISQKKQNSAESSNSGSSQQSPQEGSHYVVDGAMFKCSMDSTGGTVISQIKSTDKKVTVQNKPLVTNDDATFSNPFGLCLAQPNPSGGFNPCSYSLKWFQDNTIDTKKDTKLPTEKSMLTCSYGGQVSCVFHGQVQVVGASAVTDLKIETLSVFPLALQVKHSTPEKTEGTKASGVNKIKASKNIVRVGDKITLQAFKKSNGEDELKAPQYVNWAVSSTKESEKEGKTKTYLDRLMVFKQVCPPFHIRLDEPGKYIIEGGSDRMLDGYTNKTTKESVIGYYNLDKEKPLEGKNHIPMDKNCAVEVEVVSNNSIVGICKDGKAVKNNDIAYLKKGEKSIFTPLFLLDFDAEYEDLKYAVEYADSTPVIADDYAFNEEKKSIELTPSAAEKDYKITFFVHKKADGIIEESAVCEKSVHIHSYSEAVLYARVPGLYLKCADKGNVTLRRPDDSVEFFVVKANEKVGEEKVGYDNQEIITWRVRKGKGKWEPNGKGKRLFYKFKEEGIYEVEADLKETIYSNGGVSGIGVQSKTKNIKEKKITHKLEVTQNKVTKIAVSATNGKRYVGVKYPIALSYYFGESTYAQEKLDVELSCDGADDDCLKKGIFLATKPGEYTIKAKLYGKESEPFKINIEESGFSKWEFCDDKNHKKLRYIGPNMKVGIQGAVPAWGSIEETEKEEKRQITVALYCRNKPLSSFSPKLDKDGNFRVNGIDVNKDIIEKAKENGISYDGHNDLIITFLAYEYPTGIVKNLSRHSSGGVFCQSANLTVKSEPFFNGYFVDSNGDKLSKIINYGDVAKVHIQAMNLDEKTRKNMRLRVYENLLGIDSVAYDHESEITLDETGVAEIEIPTNSGNITKDEQDKSMLPRLFYFKIVLKDESGLGLIDFSKIPLIDGFYQLYAYPKSPYELQYFDVAKRMSDLQDDLLKQLIDKQYDSDNLKKLRSYCDQLKIANLEKEETAKYRKSYNSLAPVVVGGDWKKGEEDGSDNKTCPRCHEEWEDMLKRVKSSGVFSSDSYTNLEIICKTYCKYMEKLQMDTCWIKAHFFAQIAVESGKGLKPRSEDLCYKTRLNLENTFEEQIFKGKKVNGEFIPDRDSAEKRIYKTKAIKEKLDEIYGNAKKVEHPDEKKIAKLVYGKRTDLGNETEEDGWTYRGGGYIQVTGKGNYIAVEKKMKAVGATGFDMINNGADELKDNIELSTLASMAYLNIRGICGKGIANGIDKALAVNKIVGKNIHNSHAKKQENFDKLKGPLETKNCTFGKKFLKSEEGKNIYLINLNNSSITFMQAEGSKEYVYKVLYNNKPVRVYLFTSEMIKTYKKNEDKYTKEFEAFEFPETSKDAENNNAVEKDLNYTFLPQWGRYGQGVKESDNWVNPKTCARLLGFFFSLPLNGYTDPLFYNDISVYEKNKDKYYDGHSTHKYGNSIDLRYPRSTGGPNPELWDCIIKKQYNSKEEFITELKKILRIAIKWGFISNFANEALNEGTNKLTKYATNHADHFHLGNSTEDSEGIKRDKEEKL